MWSNLRNKSKHQPRCTTTAPRRKCIMDGNKKRLDQSFQDQWNQKATYIKRMRDKGHTLETSIEWDEIGSRPLIICALRRCRHICTTFTSWRTKQRIPTQLWHKEQEQDPKLIMIIFTTHRQPRSLYGTTPLLHYLRPSHSVSSTHLHSSWPSSSWSKGQSSSGNSQA